MTQKINDQSNPSVASDTSAELGLLAFGETFVEWNGNLTNISDLPEAEYEMFLERMRAFRIAHRVLNNLNEVEP